MIVRICLLLHYERIIPGFCIPAYIVRLLVGRRNVVPGFGSVAGHKKSPGAAAFT